MKTRGAIIALALALVLAACGGEQGYARKLGDTGCSWNTASTRASSFSASIAISGGGRARAVVDLYAPGESTALEVFGQYHKKFVDSGDDFVHQTYTMQVLSPGAYTLRVQHGGKTSRATVVLSGTAAWVVYVHCPK